VCVSSCSLLIRGNIAAVRQEIHLSGCPNFPSHLSVEAQKDISLVESAELLRVDYGATFATSTVWRFLDRHAMTVKKNGARSRAGETRRRRAAQGMFRRTAWSRTTPPGLHRRVRCIDQDG
jgi:hypothetical protein